MSFKKIQGDRGLDIVAFAKGPADTALDVKVFVVNEPLNQRQSFGRRKRLLSLTSIVVQRND